MKKMFMKALTVMAGAALIGSTMAGAAMFPTGFTSSDTAIIVGANAAPSDNIAAVSISSFLNAELASTGGSVTLDGEKYKFEKTSTKFNIGDTITGVVSTALDDDQLPTLLEAGVYMDDENNEFDYTQKIAVQSGITLSLFEDDDYKADTPTVGFKLADGASVATYTLDFTDKPDFADMENTELMMMGKSYYVLDAPATNDRLTLLDSAEDASLAEGSSVTVNAGSKTYTVETSFVGSTSAKLVVNGETTNSLAIGGTYKLKDGSYLGVKDILYSSKDTGISKVDFGIGSGKLLLVSGEEVELNEDEVDGLTVTIVNASATLDTVSIAWVTDDTEFITTDRALVIPGFETFKFVYGGVDYPAEEKIEIAAGSSSYAVLNDFPLIGSTEDIPLLYLNTTETGFAGMGKSSTQKLVTGTSSVVTDSDTDYFIVSYTGTKDAESYLARATSFTDSGSINKTTIQYRKDGSWVDAISDGVVGDEFDIGSAELNITAIADSTEAVTLVNLSAETSFNVLYSKEGLKITLPVNVTNGVYPNVNGTLAHPFGTSYILKMQEEDKDGTIAGGDTINATIGINSDSDVSITAVTGDATAIEDGDGSDKFVNIQYSDLATMSVHDRSVDQRKVTLTYHGDEVVADVYVAAMGATTSTSSGAKVLLDTNVAEASGKNLIVVGGSAINSVAARLLGGAFSEAAFTAKTDVKAGEFLIQSFDESGKIALLVAGYNAEDTTKAATYLTNEDVDTTVGKKYKGTSATQATLVTA